MVAACLTMPWSGAGLGAQDLDHPLNHLLHSHWSSLEGLPTSNYSRVVRSSDGYLWLGSTDGLIRFDGVRFVTIDGTRAPSMRMIPGVSYSMLDDSHPLVARMASIGLTLPLLADRDGAMWVAVADSTITRLFVAQPRDTLGWARFKSAFPNAIGFQRVSRVGLSRDGKWALVFAEHLAGWLNGSGRLFVLEKVDDTWQPRLVFPIWVS